jgi:hypothetical protein
MNLFGDLLALNMSRKIFMFFNKGNTGIFTRNPAICRRVEGLQFLLLFLPENAITPMVEFHMYGKLLICTTERMLNIIKSFYKI